MAMNLVLFTYSVDIVSMCCPTHSPSVAMTWHVTLTLINTTMEIVRIATKTLISKLNRRNS